MSDDKKPWSKPIATENAQRPGEVAVRFAGKLWFVNDAGGRYDGCALKTFFHRDFGGPDKELDEQVNEWARENPDNNVIWMRPLGDCGIMLLWQYRRTPEEMEEIQWTDEKLHDWMEEKRRERYESEQQAKLEKEQEEAATAYYTRTGKDFHETGALLKKLKQELGGAKKEELTKLFHALHDGSLFVALGVEVPEHLKPVEKKTDEAAKENTP